MRNIHTIIAAALVALAANACTKDNMSDESVEPIVVRFAAQAADVKAEFNPSSYEDGAPVPVLWNGGEKLSIAVGDNDKRDFLYNCASIIASDDRKSATWECDFSKLVTEKYAPSAPYIFHVFCGEVNHYRDIVGTSRVLLKNIPSEQTPGTDTCDPAAIYLYSKSDPYQTWPSEVDMDSFMHLTAYGCITLVSGIPEDAKIRSVTITADETTHLSGATWYYYKTGNKYGDYKGDTYPKPSSSITLTPSVGCDELPRTNIWFGCRPTDKQASLKSLKFTVITDKGKYEVVKSDLGGRQFKAGKVAKMEIDGFTLCNTGLKVGILGDSISTYEGYIDSSYKSYYPREEEQDGVLVKADVDDWTKTYWGILLNEYWSAELDVNASWSGTCITPRSGFNSDFLTRADTFIDPDIIIVNGGTNDYLKGKKGDGVVTPEKFRAAYEELISTLQTRYPEAQLIMVIGDFVKSDYGNISVETADKYELPYVDFRPDTKSIGKVFNDTSNPHPNAAGMRFMAEKIFQQTESIVKSLIRQ